MAEAQVNVQVSKPRVALRPSQCIPQSGLSKTTFWRRIDAGLIPAHRDGKCIVIWSDDWENYLASRPRVAA